MDSRSSTCRRAGISRAQATPCSAAKRSSPAIDSGATCGVTSGSASGWASRSCRWSWSIRGSITSTPASARWRRIGPSYYPGAFDEYGRSVLRDRIPDLIEVAAEEAVSFSCNAVVVGETVVLNDGAPSSPPPQDAGFAVRPLGFSEFIKSGGSAKCLTLRIDGEEAASWKRGKK